MKPGFSTGQCFREIYVCHRNSTADRVWHGGRRMLKGKHYDE
jgi:hypothetical protein